MLELMGLPSPAEAASTAPRRILARRISLLVVDEHPVVQHGVRLFLDDIDAIGTVDTAASGRAAITAARAERHDVVLLDPSLPDMLVEDAVRSLAAVSPGTRVVIFAAHISPSLREQALALGVQGVVGKDATPDRLHDAIVRVACGGTIFEPGSEGMLRRAAEKVNGTPLTPREHEILRHAARGESNAEIAVAIYLAPTTVKSYLQSALRKLGARNRVEAVSKLSELRIL